MTIKVKGAGNLKVRGVPGPLVNEILEATSFFLNTVDHEETLEEKKNLTSLHDDIVWTSKFPKLGYRYHLWFQTYQLTPSAYVPPVPAPGILVPATPPLDPGRIA